jgi:hypothetical protein
VKNSRGKDPRGRATAAIISSYASRTSAGDSFFMAMTPEEGADPAVAELRQEMAGAGWGLIVPFGVGSLVLLAYLRSPRSLVTLAIRGVSLQWRLFADILKVGVPGLINVAITNLSVVLLTGIAGHLGREVAIGYAMGARLEYVLIPLAFGFGTAIVATVGTNWGARQHRRGREIAWTGAVIAADGPFRAAETGFSRVSFAKAPGN